MLKASQYSRQELLDILNLDANATPDDVMEVCDHFINEFMDDPEKMDFFIETKSKLLSLQTDQWTKEEALPQTENPVQKDKTTERAQQAPVFANEHAVMTRNQLGVNNTVDIPVAQGTINPTLRNTNSHFVNIDSQFRSLTETSATSFTLDLSDKLTQVLNIRLYSIQIPYTWYTIDSTYGNNCFWIEDIYENTSTQITLKSGNYSGETFVAELNKQFQLANFTSTTTTSIAVFDPSTCMLSFTFEEGGWLDPYGYLVTGESHVFILFDPTGEKKCSCDCLTLTQPFNNTLGWIMGFRSFRVPVSNNPSAVLNLLGPKYFIIAIDDYNNNHVNNILISIADTPHSFRLPTYFNGQFPYICERVSRIPKPGESSIITTTVPQIEPTAPRTLTNAQIRTINEISKKQKETMHLKAKAPTNSDTFALVPLKTSGLSTGNGYVEFSGSLQESKRVYFGPVDIDRLKIQLIDDRGNIVNLHGADWSFTLIAETLYQY